MAGSILGISNATVWYTQRAYAGASNTFYDQSYDVYSVLNTTQAKNGQAVTQWQDYSGAGNHATAATNSPIFRAYSGMSQTIQAGVEFNGSASCMTIPSGVTIGNGSPANEGTILVAMTCPATSSSGIPIPGAFPVAIGGEGVWMVNNTPTWYNGGEHSFNYPNIWPTLHTCVWAIRFKSGQSNYYWGNKYVDSLSTNYGTSLSGGYLGSLSGSGFYFEGILHDVMIFNQALTDANMTFLLKWMQDKYCPNSSNDVHIVFAGDSRTRGYNSPVSSNFPSFLSWPAKLLQRIGGHAKTTMLANVGDTVANQITKMTAAVGTSNGINLSQWGQNILVGECGINDCNAGTAAATTYANLQSLWSEFLSNGGTQVIWGTIAPATALSSGNQTILTALNALILATTTANVAIVNNGADTRYALSGYPDTDGLHFTDAGYSVYAENFANAVSLQIPTVLGPYATALTITGNGTVTVGATNTYTLSVNGNVSATTVVTVHISGSGTIGGSSITLTPGGSLAQTFTMSVTIGSSVYLSTTNDGAAGLSNGSLNVSATAAAGGGATIRAPLPI